MMKRSIEVLVPAFSGERMVKEYAEQFYLPLEDRYRMLAADGFAKAREIHRWRTMEDSIDNWGSNVEILREFARQRPDYVRQHIIERFGLAGLAELTVEPTPLKVISGSMVWIF